VALSSFSVQLTCTSPTSTCAEPHSTLNTRLIVLAVVIAAAAAVVVVIVVVIVVVVVVEYLFSPSRTEICVINVSKFNFKINFYRK